MIRTTTWAVIGTVGLVVVAVVAALGGVFGSSLASADATTRGRVSIATPNGAAQLQLGSLDRESVEYVGETKNAFFFVGTDSENAFTCFVIARKDAHATTATGCDPADSVRSRGQFGYLEMGDGTAAVAYRSFRPILSATANGATVAPFKNVVSREVPPDSSLELVVKTLGQTFRETVSTGASRVDSVGRGERAS